MNWVQATREWPALQHYLAMNLTEWPAGQAILPYGVMALFNRTLGNLCRLISSTRTGWISLTDAQCTAITPKWA
jgi:hypothetical protein